MADYTDTLQVLAQSTDDQVVALHARLVAGELTEDQFVALATAVLAQQDARASSLADVALATALTVQTGRTVLPLGLSKVRPTRVFAGIVRDALAADDPATQVGVDARAATLETAQDTYQEAMVSQGVARWRRAPNTGACPLCLRFARATLPTTVPMYHHKGCSCTQTPIPASELETTA